MEPVPVQAGRGRLLLSREVKLAVTAKTFPVVLAALFKLYRMRHSISFVHTILNFTQNLKYENYEVDFELCTDLSL